MNTIRCPRCQLVNWGSAQECKRCSIPLHETSDAPPASPGLFVEEPAGSQSYKKVWLVVVLTLCVGGYATFRAFSSPPAPVTIQVVGPAPPSVSENPPELSQAPIDAPAPQPRETRQERPIIWNKTQETIASAPRPSTSSLPKPYNRPGETVEFDQVIGRGKTTLVYFYADW